MASREEILEAIKSHYPYRKMDNALLFQLIDLMKGRDYDDGETIYRTGEEANYFFIVLTGNVRLYIGEGDDPFILARLVTGDMFGFEMLSARNEWLVNAEADGPTTVLVLDRAGMENALAIAPVLYTALTVLFDSYYLSMRVPLDWRRSEENVYFIARRHTLFLLKRFIPVILLVLVGMPIGLTFVVVTQGLAMSWIFFGVISAITLGLGLWEYIDWSNDYSIVTRDRVVFQEKVVLLYDSRQEAPLNAILSVTTDTDQFGRWLNYGDVIIRTYAGMIVLPNLRDPQQIVALVEAEWFRARARRTDAERAEIARVIRDRIGMARSPKAVVNAPVATSMQPGPLRKWLSDTFRMRFEKGSTITYRTHWLFLMMNIFFPSLIFLSLFVVLVLRMMGIFSFLSISAIFSLVLLGWLVDGAWWVYQYADWRNDYYVITDEQVLDVYKKPLGREERQAAPLRNIQSIEFKRRGFFGVIFNFGTVFILVGEASLTFDNVFNPAEVQRELFKRIAERDYREKQATQAQESQRIADWLQIYHRVVEEERILRNSQPPGPNLR